MKIGLVVYGSLDGQSGGYLYDQRLVESLTSRGHSVRIISQRTATYAGQLLQTLHANDVAGLDLLIEDELNHPSCVRANRRLGLPIASLVHHLRSSERHPQLLVPLYRRVERTYLQSVDAFIFNSRTTESAVQELSDSSAPGVIAYPPCDRLGTISKVALNEKLTRRATERSPLRVLFVGNLIPRKNVDTLLHAVAQTEIDVELQIAGSPDADPRYARALRVLTERLGLRRRVFFAGRLNDARLGEAFANADVLAVPSDYEGFGMVYLEAFSQGVPAIGSREGAAGEIIRDGTSGFLVDARQPSALAVRFRELADRTRLRRMSQEAGAAFEHWPAWEEGVDKIEHLLRSLG